jgi:hypothetical protein
MHALLRVKFAEIIFLFKRGRRVTNLFLRDMDTKTEPKVYLIAKRNDWFWSSSQYVPASRNLLKWDK